MAAHHDAIVLGAGIVGISTAIQLRKRGLDVALVDRRGPGEETSFGNAGIIQREGVHPYLFPRDPLKLLQYGLKRRSEANYHLSSLLDVAPFLLRYFAFSTPRGARRTFEANVPLFARCLGAHEALMKEAGSSSLVSKKGWIRAYRRRQGLRAAKEQVSDLLDVGLDVDVLESADVAEIEPHLNTDRLAGAIHYRDPWTCSDPGALVKSYFELFEKLGGSFVEMKAEALRKVSGGWEVSGGGRRLRADTLTVALGPWSAPMLAEVGLTLPMGVKRGYHRHYRPEGNAYLTRPIVDDEKGFVMAPMERGIRLTTGAEFARHDAPRTPVQLDKTLPLARDLFPLTETVDDQPWFGARPVMPDMLPVMGEAPDMPGLWLNFGHGHHGFTLGPASGELLAQMIAGDAPFCDPSPYRAERFIRA